ncbi:hypothetical protein V8B97DRAFT_2014203 [Scleroderma yunnanense]
MTDSSSSPRATSTRSQYVEQGQPSVFQRPALDQTFLGVYLCQKEKIERKVAITDIKNSDLSLSVSDSLKDQSSVLDIKANLSLDVLGGLINTQSWAMALTVRTEKCCLLFAEDELGNNALDVAKDNYIAERLATHFVSGIIYGANIIISMTESSSDVSEKEDIKGKLRLELNKLKGAISFTGGAEANISKVWITSVSRGDLPKGNNDGAAASATENVIKEDRFRGVSISVTLQPIPEKLRVESKVGLAVFRLKQQVVDEALSVFGELDDVHNRFTTLVDETTGHNNLIPKLASHALASANAFGQEHRRLLRLFGQFLKDRLVVPWHPTRGVHGRDTSSKAKPESLLDEIKSLEMFQDFVLDIGHVPGGVKDKDNKDLLPSRLNSVDDHGANFAIIRLLTMLRGRQTRYQRYILYLEDPSDIDKMPHWGNSRASPNPLISSEKWMEMRNIERVEYHHQKYIFSDSCVTPIGDTPVPRRTLSVPLDKIDGTKSFSVVFVFTEKSVEFAGLSCNKTWLSFYRAGGKLSRNYWTNDIHGTPSRGMVREMTFVQDAHDQEVSLYCDDKRTASAQLVMPPHDLRYKKAGACQLHMCFAF